MRCESGKEFGETAAYALHCAVIDCQLQQNSVVGGNFVGLQYTTIMNRGLSVAIHLQLRATSQCILPRDNSNLSRSLLPEANNHTLISRSSRSRPLLL